MRGGVARLREQNAVTFETLLRGVLAYAEAQDGDFDAASATLHAAFATSERTGQRWYDAELYRTRGEILLKGDAAHPAQATEALLAALGIARAQKARSFGLRAALSLGKLYRSTGRPVEAHDVLSPALEGFSPTPEMPEIAEAEALLAALQQTEEVKADAAKQRRLTHLHVAYGNALLQARGYGASETTEVFARARESTADGEAPERLAADYGLWVGGLVRGELSSMRAHAKSFLTKVEARPDSPEAGVAHRLLGTTHWFAGEYAEARDHLERALAVFQPGRDDDLAFRFGQDAGVAARLYLALALWPLGDVERAISLTRDAQERTARLAHIGTRAYEKAHAALFELMRSDLSRSARNALELVRLSGEHDLPMWRAYAVFLAGAGAESGAPGGGLEEMRRGAELLREQSILNYDGLLKIALAEAEARAGDLDRALAILDEALATCDRTGHRAFEADLNRVRGEMLLMRDPANPAAAEGGFRTAIAIAQQQGARSFGLRAALSIAKLYQSTGRPVEAHAVLAPALEGFAPTPEMPEIAEAHALVERLA
jgi:predicted ATPase